MLFLQMRRRVFRSPGMFSQLSTFPPPGSSKSDTIFFNSDADQKQILLNNENEMLFSGTFSISKIILDLLIKKLIRKTKKDVLNIIETVIVKEKVVLQIQNRIIRIRR